MTRWAMMRHLRQHQTGGEFAGSAGSAGCATCDWVGNNCDTGVAGYSTDVSNLSTCDMGPFTGTASAGWIGGSCDFSSEDADVQDGDLNTLYFVIWECGSVTAGYWTAQLYINDGSADYAEYERAADENCPTGTFSKTAYVACGSGSDNWPSEITVYD